MRIRNHYGCDIDTEFAIDCDGTLYFLQARPLIEIAKGFTTVDLEQVPAAKVIARGYFSVPGAVSGTIKFIPSWDDLVSGNIKIEADDIVLTYLSTNYWTQYMTQFKGMITQEGGPTSHPMILCRERNVPCVIGIPNDFERLIALNGQRVTLDGMQKLIYLDDLPIKKASPSDCEQLFEPIEFLPLPSYEQIKADLKTYQMLFEEDGEGWVITPSYRMGKLLQEINLKRYEQRAKLVGVPYWPVEAKVIDGYVCDKLFSFEENLAYFSHMDLEASEAFHRKQERAIEDYLCLTRQFAFTVDHWDRYVELTSEIRAYIWLGLFYRAHIEQHIAALAQREKIPRIVQEAYATRFQSRLFSEDQAMQRDLALTSPDDPESLISLGKKYRFSKNVSFEQEFDLELVKQRVLTATPYEQEPTPLDQEIYFPDFPEFRRWVELAVNNRVLQSDFHHKQIRGQWPVREKLLELGARFFPQPEEIFNCSVAEVRELILRLAIPPMGKVKIGNV
jgi:phosphohistidine swiveling domain-containing protein